MSSVATVRLTWRIKIWFLFKCGPGSSVGIATDYGLYGPGIESRWRRDFSAHAQTGPGAHPASCTMGTWSFPRVKSGRSVTLTPHPLLVPWSRKGRAILHSLYGPYGLYRASVPVQGWHLPYLSTWIGWPLPLALYRNRSHVVCKKKKTPSEDMFVRFCEEWNVWLTDTLVSLQWQKYTGSPCFAPVYLTTFCCNSSSSSCSWRFKRVSCSLTLKM